VWDSPWHKTKTPYHKPLRDNPTWLKDVQTQWISDSNERLLEHLTLSQMMAHPPGTWKLWTPSNPTREQPGQSTETSSTLWVECLAWVMSNSNSSTREHQSVTIHSHWRNHHPNPLIISRVWTKDHLSRISERWRQIYQPSTIIEMQMRASISWGRVHCLLRHHSRISFQWEVRLAIGVLNLSSWIQSNRDSMVHINQSKKSRNIENQHGKKECHSYQRTVPIRAP
jgi:hypothetical protein